jgi:hypothetical protein
VAKLVDHCQHSCSGAPCRSYVGIVHHCDVVAQISTTFAWLAIYSVMIRTLLQEARVFIDACSNMSADSILETHELFASLGAVFVRYTGGTMLVGTTSLSYLVLGER